ncbi:MAG: hypothetical protein AAGF95_13235 [Chloroflexota bacterium]
MLGSPPNNDYILTPMPRGMHPNDDPSAPPPVRLPRTQCLGRGCGVEQRSAERPEQGAEPEPVEGAVVKHI